MLLSRISSAPMLLRVLLASAAVSSPGALTTLSAQAPQAPAVVRGYLVGLVVDKASGRPLPGTNIQVIGTTLRTQTDLDGKYRLPVPVGVYAVRAFRLGNVAQQQEGVKITAGTSIAANFALAGAVVQLEAQRVTAAPTKASSEDALLAMQRSASRVSDGISAEAIKRAPGASAGDAVVRITGVSIVDNKFAVVRGLSERYSNTLLNGVELPSPEPTKKIVPLDLFPSSLLESIIVSKTATPDKPGDFAGGSVEVSTKEFPNDRVMEVNLSSGYNTQTTFRNLSHIRQRGVDYLGFDQGRTRQMPSTVPTLQGVASSESERFAEGLRNVWTPTPSSVSPNFGGSVNIGGRLGGEGAPFGYVVSATHNRQTNAGNGRLLQVILDGERGVPDRSRVSNDVESTVDVGGIANFAARLGSTGKLGWKNLYTRGSEELLARSVLINPDAGTNVERTIYQARYVTRTLWQTQLAGDHLLNRIFGSRLEWKATLARASRDEPENRSLAYYKSPGLPAAVSSSQPNFFFFRFLEDQVRSAQFDWSFPLPSVLGSGASFKTGGIRRERERSFRGFIFRTRGPGIDGSQPVLQLPPEQVFSPEVLGSGLELVRDPTFTLPYETDESVTSGYGMVDLPIRSWLRLVTGVRNESWRLDLYPGTRTDTINPIIRRRNADLLPSANLTLKLSDRQNLRLAAYATVARPDPREVSNDYYEPVAGDCAQRGNPSLQRTRITNGDVRWERYPRSGEIMALSGFYKGFDAPIVEVLINDTGNCSAVPVNLRSARLYGGEVELRRGLTFLPGRLKQLSAGVNLTVVQSRALLESDSSEALVYPFAGQSNFLANTSLLYATANGSTEVTALLNYFSDRVSRYGVSSRSGGVVSGVPNLIERGRFGLDAKARHKVGRATFSLSVRNLLDAEVIFEQNSNLNGVVRAGYFRPGIGVNLGVGYAIR
ncbi:MAG: outer membrane beta-barrel protein [Gemmatimonadaceae bacterium]|nr:outer membrane beta-barrel protein [Gemmatimonadaceae bacterium]